MDQNALVSLKKIAFLSRIPDTALNALAMKAKCCAFPKQTVIITENDETDSLYIIISGKVKVFTSDNSGREVTLSVQDTGSYFGELALLADEPRSASVMSLEKTLCGIISKNDFHIWLAEHPAVSLCLLKDLSERIRNLTQKVKDLALSNVQERTIQVLYKLGTKQGDGSFIIDDMPTQQELASMVGASREMINKIIRDLTKKNYIVSNGKTVVLKIPLLIPD